jgi:hypothetical protein
MKTACAVLGLAFLLASQARAEDAKTTTTITRTPNGTAVITQSGDPATATTTIERKKDSTVIIRKSGGNSSTVIQGGDVGNLPDDLMPPEMRRMLKLMQQP